MPKFICVTCGSQFAESTEPPLRCPICEDERQYVGWDGQQWTTLEELGRDHRADIREEEPRLVGIGCDPSFAIGQRALLVRAAGGNVLWDCISLLDDEIGARVEELGGLAAIAISHPHYYSSMVEWARAFDAPIHLHTADREWVMRPDDRIEFWDGETRLPPAAIERIVAALEPFEFDRIYGAWWGRVVAADGKAAVRRSAERYVRSLAGRVPS